MSGKRKYNGGCLFKVSNGELNISNAEISNLPDS